MRWVVDVGYPVGQPQDYDTDLEAIAECSPVSRSHTWGVRGLLFEFKSPWKAKIVAERMAAFLGVTENTTLTHDGTYVHYHFQPTTVWGKRLHDKWLNLVNRRSRSRHHGVA